MLPRLFWFSGLLHGSPGCLLLPELLPCHLKSVLVPWDPSWFHRLHLGSTDSEGVPWIPLLYEFNTDNRSNKYRVVPVVVKRPPGL